MNTFLVATDFSPASERAAEYAVQLAQTLEASVVLCHVLTMPIITEPQAMELSAAIALYDTKAAQKGLSQQLEKLTQWQHRLPGRSVPVDTLIMQGDVPTEVVTLANKRQASLVVIGAHEHQEAWEAFAGNHASALLEHCRLPVLVVPATAPFREIRHVLFACEWLETDAQHLQWLCQFASHWDASVLVAHVNTHPADLAAETERMNQFIASLPNALLTDKLSFRLVRAESVASELEHLIEAESIDMVVMATRKRNLFQQLTHRSLTKRLARETDIPLLAFHANKLADIWLL